MKKPNILLTSLFVFAVVSVHFHGFAAEPIRVTVHDEVLHEIDARVFGQFMERPSWGEIGAEAAVVPGRHELQPEAKRMIRQMRIPIVRFPGGTDVDFVDWLDMIDNVPGRAPERPITTGHKGDRVTNNFGYDEFLRLCEELDMEAILVVNFRDGLLADNGPSEAARQAAKLVAYCNAPLESELPEELALWARLRARNGHPAPYRVKHIQIGNETWAFSRAVSEDRYLAALAAYIDAILSVDPKVRIIVDGQPAGLAARIHRELGDRIAHFAVHHYQPWQIREVRRESKPVDVAKLTDRDIWYAWVSLPRIDADGQSVLARSELEQARRLGYEVAMTEWNWNGWWGSPARDHAPLNSLFAKGVGAAGILHAMIRQADVVRIANQSMLIGDGWGIHAIYCDRHGQKETHMVPSGQVTMLYSLHHGHQRLRVDVKNMLRYEQPYQMAGISPSRQVAYLDLLATRDETTLYLHAINRHFDEMLTVRTDVTAVGGAPQGQGTLHILEGRLENAPAEGDRPAPARFRKETFDVVGNQFEVRLPARSVSVAEVPLRRRSP